MQGLKEHSRMISVAYASRYDHKEIRTTVLWLSWFLMGLSLLSRMVCAHAASRADMMSYHSRVSREKSWLALLSYT